VLVTGTTMRTAHRRSLCAVLPWLALLLLVACETAEPEPGDGVFEASCDQSVGDFPSAWTEHTFDDFDDGWLHGSGADLLISAQGTIFPYHVLDANVDGHIDLLVTNNELEGETTSSFIYWGGDGAFTADNRQELPTEMAWSWVLSDLNGDGWPDFVSVNEGIDMNAPDVSYVYWGSAEGFSVERRTSFVTVGSHAVSVGDLDRDGWLDLYVTFRHMKYSWIYWGGPEPYSSDNKTIVPTAGGSENALADFNNDGWLDILQAQVGHTGCHPIEEIRNHCCEHYCGYMHSWLYYGGPNGFSEDRRAQLRVDGRAHGLSVADLNADGWLDVVMGNWRWQYVDYMPTTQWERNSYIWWGSEDGFTELDRSELATNGTQANSVADFNQDGILDISFTNSMRKFDIATPSYVYYGTEYGFRADLRTDLPSIAGHANMVADWNDDGFPDLFITNYRCSPVDHGTACDSSLYWGSEQGLDPEDFSPIPTVGGHMGTLRDPGNIYDRTERYEYRSSAWDAGAPIADAALFWTAETPERTALRFQVRSASSEAGLEEATWLGPDGSEATWFECSGALIARAHRGDRWLQYRTEFRRDQPINGPTLQSVTLAVSP
jgi:hypothetical protein